MNLIVLNKRFQASVKEVIYLPTEKPRFTVVVSEEMLQRIDDFRFENRYSSRSAAAIELIRIGLEHVEKKTVEIASVI